MTIDEDLRPRWDYIRDQGNRSSCLACAISDAHMSLQELDHSLSVEYLFYRTAEYMPSRDLSNGATFEAIRLALEAHGQPNENEWPYNAVEPSPWSPPEITRVWSASLIVCDVIDPSSVARIIDTPFPFVLAIKLTPDFLGVTGPEFLIPSTGVGFGGHAVLAVGIGTNETGMKYLLIRNSWGATWGQQGYAWLPVAYLADKLIGFCDMKINSNH